MSKNLSTLFRNGNNTNPLAVSLGGTGSTTAASSLTALGALPTAGGVMTGAITFASGQFGTNVATFLTTPTSANFAAALTDETGTGSNVFATSPTLVTPVLGTPTSGILTNCTGLPAAGVVGTAAILGANIFTAKQTLPGNATAVGLELVNATEKITVSNTAATGTINLDVSTQSILYYTISATANWTTNVRHSSTVTLNDVMAIGEALSVVFMNTNGGTAFYASAFQVDGVAKTPKWQGSAPTAGNASAIDSYTYTIIKTGAAAFTVLAAISKFV